MDADMSQYERDMREVHDRLSKRIETEIDSFQANEDCLNALFRIDNHIAEMHGYLEVIDKSLKTSVERLDNLYNIVDLINKRIARYASRHDGVGEA